MLVAVGTNRIAGKLTGGQNERKSYLKLFIISYSKDSILSCPLALTARAE
jgi:hypothetical protein